MNVNMNNKENLYQIVPSIVESNIVETPNIKTLVLRPEKPIPFKTGQFIELTVPGVGEAPFTPSSSPLETGKMDITIMNAGRVTNVIHQLKEGDKVGLRGPYGNGYSLDSFYGKEILIVGGGVGLAPLRSLLFALFSELGRYKKVVLCYGAKTPGDILYRKSFPEWKKKIEMHLTVDKKDSSWEGEEGVVTVLLDKVKVDLKNSVAVVCGPPIMMRFVTLKVLQMGYKPEDIYLSMERNMSCGVGKCGHCMLGKYYVCKDGPVFTWEQVKDIPDVWK